MRKCPACQSEMVQLLTSWACDVCDSKTKFGTKPGYTYKWKDISGRLGEFIEPKQGIDWSTWDYKPARNRAGYDCSVVKDGARLCWFIPESLNLEKTIQYLREAFQYFEKA